MRTQAIADRIGRAEGVRDHLSQALVRHKEAVSALAEEQKHLARAVEIIQTVAQLTQRELEYHVSELVSLALAAVFPRPYKFVLKFVARRNRSEADLLLEDENGNQVNPLDATGGGVVDVTAFALRVALWSLIRPRPRPVMVLDEPFRFLSTDLMPKAGEMMHEISYRLGIQFLVITHEEELLQAADKVFRITRSGKGKGVAVVCAE